MAKSARKKSPRITGKRLAGKRLVEKEKRSFIDSLRAHKQLHEGPGPLARGATHVVRRKRAGLGTRVAVERKRFSYI